MNANLKAQIKIEKDVPMPTGHFGVDGNLPMLRKVLLRMEVGDSFLWPNNWAIYKAATDAKVKVTVRKNDNGYRVWRAK